MTAADPALDLMCARVARLAGLALTGITSVLGGLGGGAFHQAADDQAD